MTFVEDITITSTWPKPKYYMKPFGGNDETIVINLPERPNWWVRFWMFVFFGWRFEKI